MEKKLWFKAKTYGWGWTPCSWEGWLITFLYAALLVIFGLTLNESSPVSEIMFTFVFPVTFLTVAFIRIAYKKGEKPGWRWGKKQD